MYIIGVQHSVRVSDVCHILYEYSQVNTVNHNILNSLSLLVILENTNVTYSRRIPYYANHTCQLGFYVIETDRLETLFML